MVEWFLEEKIRLVKYCEVIICYVFEGIVFGVNFLLLFEKIILMMNEKLVEFVVFLLFCLEVIFMFVVDVVFFVLGLLGLYVFN